MVYKCFDKKSDGSGIKNKNISNKKLAADLHKPIIRNSSKEKVHLSFNNNASSGDLANMQLINKFDKGFRSLLFVIGIYNKHACVISLACCYLKISQMYHKYQCFSKNVEETNSKANKKWVDKDSEFYNRTIKSWFTKIDKEINSVHKEEKYVVVEKIIREFIKIHKCMTLVSKNVCIEKEMI